MAAPDVDLAPVSPELSPTHPDPAVRNAYFQAEAEAAVELGKRTGLAFAIERAIHNAWADGVQHGIHMLHEAYTARVDARHRRDAGVDR